MILWLLVLLILGAAVAAGYFQGGVRALFSLVGLLLAAFLSIPLAGVGSAILGLFGIQHPLVLQFTAPLIPFLVILLLFVGLSFLVHNKVHLLLKYRTNEDHYFRWERLNKQLGVCFGAAYGVVLAFALCIWIFLVGYFTVQVEAEDRDPWYLSFVNMATKAIDATGFSRTLSPWIPAPPNYFEAADLLGWLYHNPRAKDRLSRYPLFLPLAEEERYQTVAEDESFQTFLRNQPSLTELLQRDRVRSFVQDQAFFQEMWNLLEDHFADVNIFLETGSSTDFADFPIVDRWYFNLGASWNHVTQRKLNLSVLEKKTLLYDYRNKWEGAVLTCFLDKTLLLRKPEVEGPQFEFEFGSEGGSGDFNQEMERLGEFLTEMFQFSFELANLAGISISEMSNLDEDDEIVIDRSRYDRRRADFERLQPKFDKFGVEVVVGDRQVVLRQKEQKTTMKSHPGRWEHLYGNKYRVRYEDDGNQRTYEAFLEGDRLILVADKFSLAFDR